MKKFSSKDEDGFHHFNSSVTSISSNASEARATAAVLPLFKDHQKHLPHLFTITIFGVLLLFFFKYQQQFFKKEKNIFKQREKFLSRKSLPTSPLSIYSMFQGKLGPCPMAQSTEGELRKGEGLNIALGRLESLTKSKMCKKKIK